MDSDLGKPGNRYRIEQKIEEGGMGVVYKAMDTTLECEVAIKFIRTDRMVPEVAAKSLKRFTEEAKTLAKLTHPNIVKVTDYGTYKNAPYLVMEYLPKGTLKQVIQGRPMEYRRAARILIPIARALGYAHNMGVIHRDVKPSNILFTDSGEPMLSDFGIAKIFDPGETTELTGSSAVVGTPEYMAPEQATGEAIDRRADIYALGVVFYEMITGRVPFKANTPLAVLFKHASEPLPNPRQFIPDLPVDVESILMKALAKNPAQRFPTMQDFASALEELVFPGKEQTRTQVLPQRSQKSKFNPGWVIGGLAALIIGICGLALTLVVGNYFLNGRALFEAAPTATLPAPPTDTPKATLTPSLSPEPTLSETPSPTATLTATATPVIPYASIKVSNVYMYKGPSTDFDRITERVFVLGDRCIIIARTSGGGWILCKTEDGLTGWLYIDWVNVPNDFVISTAVTAPYIAPQATPTKRRRYP